MILFKVTTKIDLSAKIDIFSGHHFLVDHYLSLQKLDLKILKNVVKIHKHVHPVAEISYAYKKMCMILLD